MSKFCSRCEIKKDLIQFSKDKGQSSGLRPECKDCVKKYYRENKKSINKKHKEYRDSHKAERRKQDLKNKYNITLNQYNKLVEDQKGVCEICKLPETRKGNNRKIKRLSVDHCHKTGKVRGLLCQKCNSVLGYVDENKSILNNMIIYLERN